MDLQLHDGYSAAPRRVFTNTRQLLRSAYGTPTYFQFLNESGMDESYDNETLEAGFGDFLQSFQQIKGNVTGKTPLPVFGKQQAIDIGKQAASSALVTAIQPGGFQTEDAVNIAKSAVGMVPVVGSLVNLMPNIPKSVPYKSLSPEQQSDIIGKVPEAARGLLARFGMKAPANIPAPQQPAPVVAALPTGFPMVGKTAAGLTPLPQDQPKQTTFAGMDIKTLALLGIGGFLAYKFLTKK